MKRISWISFSTRARNAWLGFSCLLAHFGKESKAEIVVPRVNQDTLAQMIGTTRSRVSHFMNKFRKLGFIDYDDSGLTVHSGLLSIVLHE